MIPVVLFFLGIGLIIGSAGRLSGKSPLADMSRTGHEELTRRIKEKTEASVSQ